MSWEHVLRRDVTSVYRSRTGAAVAALIGLSTVVVVGLAAIADAGIVAVVGALLAVAVVLALVFLGSPRSIAAAVLGVAVLAVVLAVALSSTPLGTTGFPPEGAVIAVGALLSFVVPLVALVASYGAIVGERETGSVRFLLGLPNSRDDAYLGKLLSRTGVIVVPLVAALALAGLVVAVTADPTAATAEREPLSRLGGFLAMLGLAVLTTPYVLVFTGIGLTASAYADSSNRAVAVVIAAFVFLRVGWLALEQLAWVLVRPDVQGFVPRPEWFFWVDRLNPINAYLTLLGPLVRADGVPLLLQPDEGVTTAATSPWVAVVVLLGWAVLTPVGGLLYFRRRDLL